MALAGYLILNNVRAAPQGRRHDTTDAYSEEEEEEEEPMPEDEPRGRERVVQLSGYTVEVLEAASEFGADPLVYPFSFQVNTFAPPTRDAAGRRTGGGELVDSLVLSAMDARAKALWVKRIRHWHRFGWRETEFVHADESDFFYLQATMLSRETRRRSCAYPSERPRRPSLATDERASTSACGSPSAATTTTSGRPVRRRFYRAPAGAIGVRMLVPPS
ncbi:hypothetical protein PybrP1_000255 [[Pythium] brassicae (nom. inval.)]|nr:hypothetical protein PybrP1_000255 [[Pythium] brassicae (nom. inval.)]